jgi:WD40 repeat protein
VLVAFGPGGTTLAVGYDNGDVYLWDTATRKVTGILHGPGKGTRAVASLAFGPGGTLSVGATNGDVYLWHVNS